MIRAVRKLKREIGQKLSDNYGLLNIPMVVISGIVSPLVDRASHPSETAKWLKSEYNSWLDADEPK